MTAINETVDLSHITQSNNNFIDIDQMEPKNNILIIGKRGFGKSLIIKNLIKHYNEKYNITKCVVISQTEKFNKFYGNFIDGKIYDELNDNLINNIINYQKMNMDDLLIIIDDSIKHKFRSNVFNDMIINGRHYNITLIMALQYSFFSPEIRMNIDHIFLSNDEIISSRKKLYEHYCGCFSTFKKFNDAFNKLNNFNFMFINKCQSAKYCKVIDFLDKLNICGLEFENSSSDPNESEYIKINKKEFEMIKNKIKELEQLMSNVIYL